MTLLSDGDMAQWVADRPEGQQICLPPHGELLLPLLGRYQIENATLAAGAVALLNGGAGAKPDEYTEAIRRGLGNVKWLGRVQKLDQQPAVYVDGAITVPSAKSFVASIEQRLSEPVVSILGIPRDRDYAGVYQVMSAVSRALIITETDINPSTRFPTKDEALGVANGLVEESHFAEDLPGALQIARRLAGECGTILLAVSLMLVGECMLIWDVDTTAI